ncbi:extracellular solute-binding protein family 1 [Kribbella flavida DSM 17836]|uniref:Extracellular solute-binding protein family 1 n=1 Tax=Kribbella flavida (strain DSM 17836 / JCM 10339 / NBRC 14399) TaxID=479435 RepID=D2PW31_KRIFD|nr:extracellular solute-binding protein [Kribbella flavida]ADB29688.1 extracellular solute-binding protein family 1 [Kribbella flavida DSM 17836]
MRPISRVLPPAALGAAALVLLTGCLGSSDSGGGDQDANRNADAKQVELVIGANAVKGGKNSAGATFTQDVLIPKFVEAQKAKGVDVTVRFEGDGSDDEVYKQKLALSLSNKAGPDLMNLDGIWVGEFAQAGYVKPLTDTVGDAAKVDGWDGWAQIPESVQQLGSFEGKRYGVPAGTDGRVLYFNKKLFAQAGLPADWQPKSWDDILAAGQKLKQLPGVTPIQINGGTAMGEATTMQGVLPLLVGTGATIHTDGKWLGDTVKVRQVLDFYAKVYGGGLGDPVLQREAKGRDKSFAEFAAHKIGILAEGDYFWRSVVEPKEGVAKMADRDTTVGYALIPAARPGAGVKGQDFVSMSGGGVVAVNPNTKYPQQAWELLQFMNSAEMVEAALDGAAKITQRTDVNAKVLANDPMLNFVATKVLPITQYRPGLAEYPKISAALQQATADVIGGKSTDAAARAYQTAVAAAAGGKDKVAGN